MANITLLATGRLPSTAVGASKERVAEAHRRRSGVDRTEAEREPARTMHLAWVTGPPERGTRNVGVRRPRCQVEFGGRWNSKFIRSFNPNIARTPHGMRIDRRGNIWVIDSFMNIIMQLNAKGEPIATYGVRGENAPWDDTKWNGMFNQPLDVNWDREDNCYVVQSHGGTSPPKPCTFCATYDSDQVRSQLQQSGQRAVLVSNPPAAPGSDPRVLKFDKNGKYITSHSLKHADGTPATVHSVIVSPQREVWVTDRQLKKIYVLDENLKLKREIQEDYLTCGLFVDSQGSLWMSAGADGMIMKLDWSGKVLGLIGKPGSNPESNDIGEAHYLVVTPDQKTIYVADTVSNHILKLEHN